MRYEYSYARSIAVCAADANAADYVVAQALVSAFAVAPTTDYNSARTVAVAGSSASSLRSDPSFLVPPVCVDLFGFVVHSEFREVVSKLISDVCCIG